MENFAQKLKEARKAAGLTQQGLSDIIEAPKRTIEDWEVSKSTPPSYVQKLILRELKREAERKHRQKYRPEPPFGYRQQGGELVPNEEEAAAIKKSHQEIRDGGDVSAETKAEINRLLRKRLDAQRRGEIEGQFVSKGGSVKCDQIIAEKFFDRINSLKAHRGEVHKPELLQDKK